MPNSVEELKVGVGFQLGGQKAPLFATRTQRYSAGDGVNCVKLCISY